MAGDRVVDEVKLHQETIASDTNTPLQRIREKELEISGRMLSAKREADEIVTGARKQAAEIVARAEAESGGDARATADQLVASAEQDVHAEQARAAEQIAALRAGADSRLDAAVELVIRTVTTV